MQWIYGGAFAVGDGSSYDGTTVVQHSVRLGEPVIYVNFNYRLNAFGFLAGKEGLAGGAANIGFHDREYNDHYQPRPPATSVFLDTFDTTNNKSGILQRSSSLSGYRHIFPSSAVIHTRLLCKYPVHHHPWWLISRANVAGAKARAEFPSPPISSRAPSTPHSEPLLWCALVNSKIRPQSLRPQLNQQDSGFSFPTDTADSPRHQAIYDQLVQYTGCSLAPDTLECLRAVPYANLTDAVNATPPILSPNGLDIAYAISIDGELIQKSVSQYINEGCYARIPILGTQVDDEGT